MLLETLSESGKTTRAVGKVLHTYQLRDQAGNNAPGRKSMLLGTLGDTKKGIWVSFDKRPGMGLWQGCTSSDDSSSLKFDDFQSRLI